MHVLVTGMSGTGKSSVVAELRRRGRAAFDADDDGFSEPTPDGTWRWRVDAVARLLDRERGTLFFAGCSDEQAGLAWDRVVLLTAPEEVLLDRLESRTTNTFGKTVDEQARVLADLREVEPLLRKAADVIIDATQPLARIVDQVVACAEH